MSRSVSSELIDSGRPVVVVIFGGRAQVLSRKILDGATAIVQAWYRVRWEDWQSQISSAVQLTLVVSCTSYPATEGHRLFVTTMARVR